MHPKYMCDCVVFSVLLPLGHSGVPCLQAGCFSKHSSQKNQTKAAEERGSPSTGVTSFLGSSYIHVALNGHVFYKLYGTKAGREGR